MADTADTEAAAVAAVGRSGTVGNCLELIRIYFEVALCMGAQKPTNLESGPRSGKEYHIGPLIWPDPGAISSA